MQFISSYLTSRTSDFKIHILSKKWLFYCDRISLEETAKQVVWNRKHIPKCFEIIPNIYIALNCKTLYGEILRNSLKQLWGLASPKSAGQSQSLETQERAWSCSLSQKAVQKQNSLFLGGPQSCSPKALTDCIKLTHVMEGNLLYSKSTN